MRGVALGGAVVMGRVALGGAVASSADARAKGTRVRPILTHNTCCYAVISCLVVWW